MLYPVAIEPGDDKTAFGVAIPDIPGCFSAGDTFEEAVVNAKQAIEGHLEILCVNDMDIPQPRGAESHIKNPEYNGWVWAVIDVDITPFLGKSHKINVTLPEVLIKRIDNTVACQPNYKSRSGFLAQAAVNELSRLAV